MKILQQPLAPTKLKKELWFSYDQQAPKANSFVKPYTKFP